MWNLSYTNILCGAFIASILMVAGCQPTPTGPTITTKQAQGIKSGTSLAVIEQQLGPSRPATSAEIAFMQPMIDQMPANMKSNALADRAIAWGNPDGFLVGRVNQEGIVWVLSAKTK